MCFLIRLYNSPKLLLLMLYLFVMTACTNTSSSVESTEHAILQPSPIAMGTLSSMLSPTAKALIGAPVVFPKFVRSVNPKPAALVASPQCIDISLLQSAVWEPGNTAGTLVKHLFESFQFTLDGQIFTVNKNLLTATGAENTVYTQKTPAGSYGDTLDACIIVLLSNGLHIVNVQVSSLSGVIYSYTWAFEVKNG